eukprot:6176543-Pleurochrysis_carterae.AAC.1
MEGPCDGDLLVSTHKSAISSISAILQAGSLLYGTGATSRKIIGVIKCLALSTGRALASHSANACGSQ